MSTIDPSSIRNGDIVLLECSIKRWNTDKGNLGHGFTSGRQSTTRNWSAWDVGFVLDAISLLFPGSEFYKDPVPKSEDVVF